MNDICVSLEMIHRRMYLFIYIFKIMNKTEAPLVEPQLAKIKLLSAHSSADNWSFIYFTYIFSLR